MSKALVGQVHDGGLSTQEGLIGLVHDGYVVGNTTVPAIDDKRLLVIEPEFGHALAKFRAANNGLSVAIRKLFDGTTLAPAIKHNKISVTDPHVGIAASITPTELRAFMSAREIHNGFANRFIFIFAERKRRVPRPQAMPKETVAALAKRVTDVIAFVRGNYPTSKDSREMTFTPAAAERWDRWYLDHQQDHEDTPTLEVLLQRRAPILIRLAMLFALCDHENRPEAERLLIDLPHLEAGLAWVDFWEQSVRFIFGRNEEAKQALAVQLNAQKIVAHLEQNPPHEVSRQDLVAALFPGKKHVADLDAALQFLLLEKPPRIEQLNLSRADGIKGGRLKRLYRLAA